MSGKPNNAIRINGGIRKKAFSNLKRCCFTLSENSPAFTSQRTCLSENWATATDKNNQSGKGIANQILENYRAKRKAMTKNQR